MSGYRFILANDDLEMCSVFRMIAKSFPGSNIWLFSNREEALDHILQNGTDLLIMNAAQGGLPGLQVIRELESRELNVPFILLLGSFFAAWTASSDSSRWVLRSSGVQNLENCMRRLLQEPLSNQPLRALEGWTA